MKCKAPTQRTGGAAVAGAWRRPRWDGCAAACPACTNSRHLPRQGVLHQRMPPPAVLPGAVTGTFRSWRTAGAMATLHGGSYVSYATSLAPRVMSSPRRHPVALRGRGRRASLHTHAQFRVTASPQCHCGASFRIARQPQSQERPKQVPSIPVHHLALSTRGSACVCWAPLIPSDVYRRQESPEHAKHALLIIDAAVACRCIAHKPRGPARSLLAGAGARHGVRKRSPGGLFYSAKVRLVSGGMGVPVHLGIARPG